MTRGRPPLPPTTRLGVALRARRTALGHTSQVAADAAGVVKTTWGRWEAGESRPVAFPQLRALADYLGPPWTPEEVDRAAGEAAE